MNGPIHAKWQETNKIRELEVKLANKDKELAVYKENLITLNEALDRSANLFEALLSQLKTAETHLKYSNQSVDQTIDQLNQDNKNLRISNDMWLKRVIKLELELLKAKELHQQTDIELRQIRNKLKWLIC